MAYTALSPGRCITQWCCLSICLPSCLGPQSSTGRLYKV